MEKLIGKLRHGKLGTEEISKPNKKYFVFFILHILCIFFFFYWYEMLGQGCITINTSITHVLQAKLAMQDWVVLNTKYDNDKVTRDYNLLKVTID